MHPMKVAPHHVQWKEMPEPGKFRRLAPSRKQVVNTVKVIAYRVETAMASVVREAMARGDDARSLLCDLLRSEADLLPELERQIMRVHVHPMSNPRSNRAIAHLLQHLNDSEFTYPGTNLRLVYSIVGAGDSANPVATQIPPDPEV
jgi:Transposase protein